MSKRILFIYNPYSGASKKGLNEQLILNYFSRAGWECDIQPTTHCGHARELAEAATSTDVIAAVGGDGTVNEIASAIANSKVALAIIPRGSGNGLSNFLGLPVKLNHALAVIKAGKTRQIDTMSLNDFCFVNMAGVGFDAHIAHLFKNFGTRGFISYSRLALREFRHYPGLKLRFHFNGTHYSEERAFVVSFANSSQYGNNAFIAPRAVIDDGLIDVCIVKKFPLLEMPGVLIRLFNKSLDRSRFYNNFKVSEMVFESDSELFGHVDGEPIVLGKSASLKVYPQNLTVVVP